MSIIMYEVDTVRKSTGEHTSEKRSYVGSLPTFTPASGSFLRKHWSIESMHRGLDFDLQQDNTKRRSGKAARNPDTIQRIVYSVFSAWKGLRKKVSDKKKGISRLMRHISMNFTKLFKLLYSKIITNISEYLICLILRFKEYYPKGLKNTILRI